MPPCPVLPGSCLRQHGLDCVTHWKQLSEWGLLWFSTGRCGLLYTKAVSFSTVPKLPQQQTYFFSGCRSKQILVLVRPIYHAAALFLSQTDRAPFLGGLDQAAKSRHVSGVGGEPVRLSWPPHLGEGSDERWQLG